MLRGNALLQRDVAEKSVVAKIVTTHAVILLRITQKGYTGSIYIFPAETAGFSAAY
jgi:hypothetical protein